MGSVGTCCGLASLMQCLGSAALVNLGEILTLPEPQFQLKRTGSYLPSSLLRTLGEMVKNMHLIWGLACWHYSIRDSTSLGI